MTGKTRSFCTKAVTSRALTQLSLGAGQEDSHATCDSSYIFVEERFCVSTFRRAEKSESQTACTITAIKLKT